MNGTSGLGLMLKMAGIDPDVVMAEFRQGLNVGIQAAQEARQCQAALVEAVTAIHAMQVLQDRKLDLLHAKLDRIIGIGIDSEAMPVRSITVIGSEH